MSAIKQSIKKLGIRRACTAFGLCRAAYYRLEQAARLDKAAQAALNRPVPEAQIIESGAVDSPRKAPIDADREAGAKAPFAHRIGAADVASRGAAEVQRRLSAPAARRVCAVPGRALTDQEEQTVLDVLHSAENVDLTPVEAYVTLLDKGQYVCSVSTMYRILNKHGEVKERRAQRRHTAYARPELLATGPNQVWSWDITKLKGSIKWSYYHLYVIIDVYSRYVVGWMVADRESEDLAKDLISQSILSQKVAPGQLTIHADRGSSMSSKTLAELMSDLGVTKSQSRPHVSNDNPYSESHFRTIKYRPEFPERFSSLEDARLVCRKLLNWYNTQHYHSGIGFLTPESAHYGKAEGIVAERAKHLAAAYAAHPQRFVNRAPAPKALPAAVYINRPATAESVKPDQAIKVDEA